MTPGSRTGSPTTPTSSDITESESLLFGTDFGVVTDIETGPNGNLFVVSLTRARSTKSLDGGPYPDDPYAPALGKPEGGSMHRMIVLVLTFALGLSRLAPTAWAGDTS